MTRPTAAADVLGSLVTFAVLLSKRVFEFPLSDY
jgi:hypothetical protein